MTVKNKLKFIKNILVLLVIFTPINTFASSTTWNLNTDTEYTVSDTIKAWVLWWSARLKPTLSHEWSIVNWAWWALLNQTQGIEVVWNYAYLTTRTSNALEIVDISNPTIPTHVWSLADWWAVTLRRAQDLVVDWNYAYITALRDDAIEIVNISNPANPTHVSSIRRSATIQLNWAIGIEKVWNYLYVAAKVDDWLEIIDVTNPAVPAHVWALTDATRLNWAEDIKIVWNYAYMTSKLSNSFQIIDISNPAIPTFVWQLTNWTLWANLNWASWIAINWNYAYVAANAWNAIEIIDISNPTNPTHVSSIANWWTTLLSWPENIVIDWNFAYITSNLSDAIEVLDISNPYSPSHENSIVNGWTTLLNWAKDIKKIWNYIYVASDVSNALEIIKVSYTNTSPNIISNNPLIYSWSVDQLTSTLWSWNQWNVTYQISKDNWATWYYLSWTNRLTTTGWTLESNTPAEINYEIQSFNWLAWWTWEFKWKAFLNWNWSQKVELDEVQMDSTSAWVNEILDFETPGWYTVSQWTWTRQSVTVQEWSFSIEANNWWANNSTSCFDVDRTIYNDSTLSFFKSVDSESTDFLRFYIDWIKQSEWSWNIWWSQENYNIWNWIHNFKWCYEKDWSVNTWADTWWVDYIEIVEKPITPPPVVTDIIDFETATWYTVTAWIWNRQTTTVYEWSFSAQADNLWANNSQSCFETTRNLTSDSTISFYKSVSSEANYDFLRFYVDGWVTGQWSWNIAWGQEIYPIIAWTHTFKWCYEKDASVSRWSDTAWVDYIKIATDPNPPVLTPVLDFETVWWYTVTTAITTPGPDWKRVTTQKYEGLYSIESQNQFQANTTSCFERVQTVWSWDTWISFYKKVESIAAWPDRDFLRFYINWVKQSEWSWSAGRSREIYNLNPGTYTLKWCYEKNWTWNSTIDKAWIDIVSLTQDSPILTEVTPVPTPTNDNTPSYTFNSPIAWDIVYGWSCTSTTSKAAIWNNTIVFNSLPDWIYTNCTIQVLWSNYNSTTLAVSNFTIDTTRITNTINYPIDTSTIPDKSFDFDVSYSDTNGVDTWSIVLNLFKFDSWYWSYWSDIASSYVDFSWATIWWTWAIYPVSQLWSGQYKFEFSISDTSWNVSTTISEFLIKTPPLTLTTTINNSGWWVFNYEFNVKNTSSSNITNWIIWFQLDNWTITTSSGWTFSNSWNLFEVVSNSPSTITFTPWQIHTISFSWTWNWIVTDLYLIWYTNISPEIPIDYFINQNWLDVNVTTTSINWNEYCRNIALTNTWTQDITNWQIQFDLDQTVYNTSSGTFSQNWITHTIDPLWNANITVWNTENINFCTNWLKADNNWLISLVTLSLWDITPPTISSNNPIGQEVKPNWTFDFIFNYSDNVWWDWINTSNDEIYLYKWDWSVYWTDIASTNMFLWSKTITTTTATYSSNNIANGQYKVVFKIFDLNNNFATKTVEFYVWTPPVTDTTPPTITNIFPTNGILYPNSPFDISINYSDSESGINTSSVIMNLKKWNWSTWWTDISWTYVTWSSITSSNTTYNLSKLWYWKYKIYFYIEDNSTNSSFSEVQFYIDEPELIINTWSLDIWNLTVWANKFSSSDFTITAKTLWVWFDIILNKESSLNYLWTQITDWNWVNWYWYDKSPYTSTINLINTNEIIASQTWSINTDWNKKTYIYNVKLWANIDQEQAAWDYTGNIKFWIKLNYLDQNMWLSNSCTTNPWYSNTTYTEWSPSMYNQAWQNTNPTNACYYQCNSWWFGNSCEYSLESILSNTWSTTTEINLALSKLNQSYPNAFDTISVWDMKVIYNWTWSFSLITTNTLNQSSIDAINSISWFTYESSNLETIRYTVSSKISLAYNLDINTIKNILSNPTASYTEVNTALTYINNTWDPTHANQKACSDTYSDTNIINSYDWYFAIQSSQWTLQYNWITNDCINAINNITWINNAVLSSDWYIYFHIDTINSVKPAYVFSTYSNTSLTVNELNLATKIINNSSLRLDWHKVKCNQNVLSSWVFALTDLWSWNYYLKTGYNFAQYSGIECKSAVELYFTGVTVSGDNVNYTINP